MALAKDFELKGPRGTYSHCWISRADQSLSNTIPKIWSQAFSIEIGWPSSVGLPITNAVSSSKSSLRVAEKTGRSSFGSLICPDGRTT